VEVSEVDRQVHWRAVMLGIAVVVIGWFLKSSTHPLIRTQSSEVANALTHQPSV
jgi:hypothetical protein